MPSKEEMNKVEILIGRVLQIGVYLSAFVIISGIVLWMVKQGSGYNGPMPVEVSTIYHGVIALKPYAVVMFGIFLLILTPVLRVVISIWAFFKEKDNLYVLITSIVLVILIIGMLIGYIN